jgi:hypothetical protein
MGARAGSLFIRAAADVEEVGGFASVKVDDVKSGLQ